VFAGARSAGLRQLRTPDHPRTFVRNQRPAWIAWQPIPSTKKLEQEIANEDRRLERLTDRLAQLDETHLDAVIAQTEEIVRPLATTRDRLAEVERAGHRPKVQSVREQEIVAKLGHLRDHLLGDVDVAAQVLTTLVGDVVGESRAAAVTIGVPRNAPIPRRWATPEAITSAPQATAVASTMSSSGLARMTGP
jgi:hypothetical protein